MATERRFRVAEIFGPTIQGEGRNVGMPCHFVRFGGCDFRCTWCDTPHAVLPEMVNELPKMDAWAILLQTTGLTEDKGIEWVVFTGGNPGLLNLDELITKFHNHGYKVMVETQGTTYRPWYLDVDDLCISPKPPSAGNITNLELLARIFDRMEEDKSKMMGGWIESSWLRHKVYLKVPIFTDSDLDYAENVHSRFPDLELFLSIGNVDPTLPTVGSPNPLPISAENPDTNILFTRDVVLNSFREIVETILATRPRLQDCRIFPQQHTLLWGNERGH